MQNILITGASSGIGLASAKYLVKKGCKVWGSVRKEKDALKTKAEIGDHFTPLLFDVTDKDAIQEAAAKLKTEIGDEGLAGLVNNAGIAVSGPLMHIPIEEIRHQFEVNVIGLIQVTQSFLPLLGAYKNCPHPPGRIVNISSVSGKLGAPFIAPYVGSKHAVEGISQSMRRELMLYGIDVIIVAPGAIKTPIWDKDTGVEMSLYEGSDYEESGEQFRKMFIKSGKQGLHADKLGALIYKIFQSKKPKTRYDISPNYWSETIISKFVPDRVVDKILKKNLKL